MRFNGFDSIWDHDRLGNYVETITDFVAAGSFAVLRKNVIYYSEPQFAQLIRTTDLKNGILKNPVFIDEKAFKYLWRVNLDKPAVVLPNIGANIGEVYYISAKQLEYCNNVLGPNAILLRKIKNNYYLYTYLLSKPFQNELIKLIGASGQPKFNKTELKNIFVNFPNACEQQKISNFFSLLDQRIDTQSKIIEDLESKIEWIRNEIFKKNYKSFNHSLSDYLSEYTERNVNNFYTPVAVGKYGIRKREEIYSKELAADYSKNKVIYIIRQTTDSNNATTIPNKYNSNMSKTQKKKKKAPAIAE